MLNIHKEKSERIMNRLKASQDSSSTTWSADDGQYPLVAVVGQRLR
jgi:hypothetical protein